MSIANELIARGWTQGQREDDDGRVCLLGALSYSIAGHSQCRTGDQFSDGWRALGIAVGMQSPVRWNDDAARTFDEVLRVAKEADEILDAQ
jgi:hypothetical protein